MSLNQLINKTGGGISLDIDKLLWSPYEALLITTPTYTITLDNLVKQQMLIFNVESDALTISLPLAADLLTILPNINDYLEITLKYRTSGFCVLGATDIFFIGGSGVYELEPSNGGSYKSLKVGVGRPTVSGGALRFF